MKRRCLATLCLALLAAAAAEAEDQPRTGSDRVVLRTPAGDIVVSLYDGAAPGTTAQFRRMVQAGIYDGTHFARVERAFILQVSTAEDRDLPMNAAQTALLKRMPLEAKNLKHRRGTLSMARPDGDPDGAISSFCIMLADSPHLDGKYTPFGQVEEGFDVIDELREVPVDGAKRPTVRLRIGSMVLLPSAAAASRIRASRRPLAVAAAAPSLASGSQFVGLILALLVGALLVVAFRQAVRPKLLQSVLVITLLVGGFGLVCVMLPAARQDSRVGLLLFAVVVSIFKAMGRFEAPPSAAPAPAPPAAPRA